MHRFLGRNTGAKTLFLDTWTLPSADLPVLLLEHFGRVKDAAGNRVLHRPDT